MRNLIFFFILSAPVGVHGQDYLVTTGLDTLRGKISIESYEKMDKAAITQGKDKTEYPAYMVLLIYLDNSPYQAVRVPDSFRFMKVAKSGMLSLCYARQSPGTPFNIPYLVKKTGGSLEVNALRFKRTMTEFLKDCTTMGQSIEDGTLGRDDLEIIVDQYNRCLMQQSTVAFTQSENPKLDAVTAFNKKLEKDASAPEEAREILKDLYIKVKDGKSVPNYLAEGLRQALKDFPVYLADLDVLLEELKK